FFQAEDGIRARTVTGVQTCALPIFVVGAGAAGLYTALVAAREGAQVALVSRSPLAESASYWAQGGVAAALAADDSPELHLEDTRSEERRVGKECRGGGGRAV